MTKRYEEVALERDAVEYLISQARHGKTLAQLVAQRSDLLLGTASALIPASSRISPNARHRFTGHLLLESEAIHEEGWVRVPTIDQLMAEYVRDFLEGADERVAVLEDEDHRGDSRLFRERCPSRVRTFGNEVYHLLLPGDALGSIKEAIDWAASLWLFVGVLSILRPHDVKRFSDKPTVDSSDLEAVVQHASRVILGAYDGEGYLVWSAPIPGGR